MKRKIEAPIFVLKINRNTLKPKTSNNNKNNNNIIIIIAVVIVSKKNYTEKHVRIQAECNARVSLGYFHPLGFVVAIHLLPSVCSFPFVTFEMTATAAAAAVDAAAIQSPGNFCEPSMRLSRTDNNPTINLCIEIQMGKSCFPLPKCNCVNRCCCSSLYIVYMTVAYSRFQFANSHARFVIFYIDMIFKMFLFSFVPRKKNAHT